MAPERRVTVLIADDDALMRAGLAAVLESDAAIEIVGYAGNGLEVVRLAAELSPDVVLMDVRMPDLDGITATARITAADPRARVLILTTFEEDEYIFGGLRAGASGFLLKRTRPEELITGVHTVAAGDALLSPSVTRRVIEEMARSGAPIGQRADGSGNTATNPIDELTTRELEVLLLIGRGLSNAEIAHELVIEPSTVKSHVKRILMKLDLRDRVQAVVYVYEHGLSG